MRGSILRLALFLNVPLLIFSTLPAPAFAAQSNTLCAITGSVTDDKGAPLVGAVISILREGKVKDVIASVRTNEKGLFSAAKLIPGLYRLYATAQGFKTEVVERTEVIPDRPLILNLTLRPAIAFSKTNEVEPVKYQNRRNRSIFQATEAEQASNGPAKAVSPFSEAQGRLGFVSQTSPSPASVPGSAYAVEISQPISETSLVVTAIEGDAHGDPLRMSVKATFLRDSHVISARVGGQRTFSFTGDQASATRRSQAEIRIADAWSLASGLSLLYGFDLTRLEGDSDPFLFPRVGLQWLPSNRLRIQAGITPDGVLGSNPLLVESGETFLTPSDRITLAAPANADGPSAPILNRSFRIEAGASWQATTSTVLEASAFRDTMDGNPIGLLLDSAQSPLVVRQDGRQYGLRVVLKKQLLQNIALTAGYAVGEGQRFAASPIAESLNFLPTRYQVFALQASGSLPSSDTRLIIGYRKTLGRPLFAIDPFQGQMASFAPGLSVSIIQPLPMWGFIPGKWQVLVEGRNLLDQADELSNEQALQTRLLNGKTVVRGGLGLRF